MYFSGLNTGNVAKLYGVKSRKCLKLLNNQILSISGHFENDELMVRTKPRPSLFSILFIENYV